MLLSNDDYPIYALDVREDKSNTTNNNSITSTEAKTKDVLNCIAIGGGRDGSFLGVPIYLYNFGKAT